MGTKRTYHDAAIDSLLSQKASVSAVAAKADATALSTHINDTLDAHDASAISFDDTLSDINVDNVQAALDAVVGLATEPTDPNDHNHDSRYYTEAEVDAIVAGISGGSGGGLTSLSTLASLKAVSTSGLATGTVRYVQGYYSAGDGGQGFFRYDSTSTATADDGWTILPNSGTGRWFRDTVEVDTIRPEQFGAIADNATDYTTRFQSAANFAANKTLRMRVGNYMVRNLTVPANSNWLGVQMMLTTIKRVTSTPSGDFLAAASGATNIVMREFTLDNQLLTDQHVFSVGSAGSSVDIQRVRFLNGGTQRWMLRFDPSGVLENPTIKYCIFQNARGGIICLPGAGAQGKIRHFDVSYNIFINVGHNVIALHDYEGVVEHRWDCYFHTKCNYNIITQCPKSGDWNYGDAGPIPVENWGQTSYESIGNLIDSGTRGLSAGQHMRNGVVANNLVMNQTAYFAESGACINVAIVNNVSLNNATFTPFTNSSDLHYFTRDYLVQGNIHYGSSASSYPAGSGRSVFSSAQPRYVMDNVVIKNNIFKDPLYCRFLVGLTGSLAEPIITFAGGGSGATAYATLKAVEGYIISGGNGYTAPTITVHSEEGTGMSLSATVTGGVITGITVNSAGSGYLRAPKITITDTTGRDALIDVVMGISAVTILTGGSGYTAPTVTINNNGGFNFTGTVQQTGGVITGVTITNAGRFFGRPSTITFEENTVIITHEKAPLGLLNIGGAYVYQRRNLIYSRRHVDEDTHYSPGYTLISAGGGTNGNNRNAPVSDISNNEIYCLNTYDVGHTVYYAIGANASVATAYGESIRDNYIEGAFRSAVINSPNNAPERINYRNNTINTVLTGTYTGRITGYSNNSMDTAGTAAPTTGTWRVGDRCWNTASTAGSTTPIMWVCTAAGTPGTWLAIFSGASAKVVGSAVVDPVSLTSASGTSGSFTVTGAALGDFVAMSFSLSLQGMVLTGYVSAADTVAWVLRNSTTGTIDLASGTMRAECWRS